VESTRPIISFDGIVVVSLNQVIGAVV